MIEIQNVGIMLYSYYPYRGGGREVWLNEMSQRLSGEKYNFHFYTISYPFEGKPLIKISDSSNIVIQPVTSVYTIVQSNKMLTTLFKSPITNSLMIFDFYLLSLLIKSSFLKESNNNAIFIAPNLGFECLPAISIKKDRPSCKLLTLAMGEWLKDISMAYPYFNNYLRKIELKTASLSDIIVYPSETQYELERKRLKLSQDKIRICPFGGVDNSIFKLPTIDMRNEARRVLGLNDDDFVLVNVAVVRKLKGQDILIKALSKSKVKKNIVLFLIGRGDEEYVNKILKFASENVKVFHLGWQNRTEIVKVFWGSDVFVLPSLSEALPISIMEALASGLPVIASRTGGVPELVRDMGILVNPGDESDLVNGVEDMYNNIDFYRKKVIIGRNEIIQTYSLENTIKSFEKILDEI